jgi:hypothetical protein
MYAVKTLKKNMGFYKSINNAAKLHKEERARTDRVKRKEIFEKLEN